MLFYKFMAKISIFAIYEEMFDLAPNLRCLNVMHEVLLHPLV